MKTQRLGAAIAAAGAVYLVAVSWLSSWWYVPVLEEFGPRTVAENMPYGGMAFFIVWGASGIVGAIIVALGAAVYSAAGAFRVLLLAAGAVLLALWLVFWSLPSDGGAIFGVGGGLILLFFLMSCLDWAGTRRQLDGRARTVADLRLAANASFFIAAWGLCGLLGAPIFVLRPALTAAPQMAAFATSTMAAKVLVCLVLGWGFTAIAQRMERRERENASRAAHE